MKRIRAGEEPESPEVKALGEQCTAEFFRIVVESLADSFEPVEVEIYERLMRAWVPAAPRPRPELPAHVDCVCVLSRVTLGADIKIASPMLSAMQARFPKARMVFVANGKSAELFAGNRFVEILQADYPRGSSIAQRIEFAHELRRNLDATNRIVIDPDSRMTQLGLIPACEPDRYFHFPSRTIGGNGHANLSELVTKWLTDNFGVSGPAWIDPAPVQMDATRPIAAVSLGVGENESKRLGLEFETRLLASLGRRFRTIFVDRGVGGEEARRVTEAAQSSGEVESIRFWEGSFAGFASIIGQSDFYTGYDSAGQHAAAAAGTPLATIFRGAPSERFRHRWAPNSRSARLIDADSLPAEQILSMLDTVLSGHL